MEVPIDEGIDVNDADEIEDVVDEAVVETEDEE